MSQLHRKMLNAKHSWRAVRTLLREELSFQVHAVFAFATVVLSFLLNISRTEFIIVILMIGAVLAVEALNTAIEELCDHVTPEQHPHIGKVKDLGSGASLLIGIAALVVGALIFLPYLA